MMRRSLAGPRDNAIYRNNVIYSTQNNNVVTLSENTITYEGILNEYCFNNKEEYEHLFTTDYSSAIAKNVETGELEPYFCLEMMSKLDGAGLARNGGRPPMNFCFVLDISGSMDCSFGQDSKTKLDVAKECLINLLSRLKPSDQFGIILFDTSADTLSALSQVDSCDLSEVKRKLLAVRARGGTSVLAGLQAASTMMERVASSGHKNMNRILFLTDLLPSSLEEKQIIDFAHTASSKGLFLSVIGIGLNFNADLSYQLAKVKGCNSFGVESANQFRKQMVEDFDHFEVVEIYGSPATPNKAAGEVLKIDSICPSSECDEGIKGGVVLLKLKSKNQEQHGDNFSLSLTYKDWNDVYHERATEYTFPDTSKEYYETAAVRKAVALVQYPQKVLREPLASGNKELLEKCKQYLTTEMEALNDTSMSREILMLDSHLKKAV